MSDEIINAQELEELATILDMVRWSVSRFNEAGLYFGHGTDNAWDEAVSLVLQALHLPADLTSQTGDSLFQARLTFAERQAIAEYVAQRVQTRMPLPYITKQAWFCDLPFYVDERVLIPRSPFAELIRKRLYPYVEGEPQNILDLCTGGGCIAIALAYAFPHATVDAVDISQDALDVADINIHEHALSERVYPIKSDLFSNLEGQRYDVIVSNPPYVDAEDHADMPDEYHHEPTLALAAGEDGLELVDIILRDAPDYLVDGGWLLVEVGNSMIYMDDRYPGLNLEWIEFEHGGLGVFAVSKDELIRFWQQD